MQDSNNTFRRETRIHRCSNDSYLLMCELRFDAGMTRMGNMSHEGYVQTPISRKQISSAIYIHNKSASEDGWVSNAAIPAHVKEKKHHMHVVCVRNSSPTGLMMRFKEKQARDI